MNEEPQRGCTKEIVKGKKQQDQLDEFARQLKKNTFEPHPNKEMKTFKQRHALSTRKAESQRITKKYPERVAVIVEPKGKTDPLIEREKFLVPADLTVGQFYFVVLRRLSMQQGDNLFLFSGSALLPNSFLMQDVRRLYQDKGDGFLYVAYSRQDSFG